MKMPWERAGNEAFVTRFIIKRSWAKPSRRVEGGTHDRFSNAFFDAIRNSSKIGEHDSRILFRKRRDKYDSSGGSLDPLN